MKILLKEKKIQSNQILKQIGLDSFLLAKIWNNNEASLERKQNFCQIQMTKLLKIVMLSINKKQ